MRIRAWTHKAMFYLLFASSVFTGMAQTYSQPDTILRIDREVEYDLEAFAKIYPDTSERLSIAELQQRDFLPLAGFQPSVDVSVYWVHLSIRSGLDYPTSWRLLLFEEWCESVAVYSKTLGTPADWQLQKAGFLTPIQQLDQQEHERELLRKSPDAVSVFLSAGETKRFFIRYQAQHKDYLLIRPSLLPMVTAANRNIDYDQNASYVLLFMGMLAILALYHLLVFFMTKDRAYLYYALYGFCGAFAATVMDEFALLNYHLFYSHYPQLQAWSFILFGVMTVLAYLLFTRSFLETKKRFPKVDLAIRILVGLGLLSMVIISINFVLTDRQYLPGMPFSGFIVLVVIVYVILLRSIWRERRKVDLFYMAGLGVMLVVLLPEHIFNLFQSIDTRKYYDDLFEPFNPLQVGLLVELLVFALGLGYRTRQVEREKQRFAELDTLKSRLYTNITHEFRTPLTVIMGMANNIRGHTQEKELINRNSENLLQLINQLLDLSKLNSGSLQLEKIQADIVSYLQYLTESFYSMAEEKQIRLSFYPEVKEVVMDYDEVKIQHIVYNLLTNAIKFTPEGGKVFLHIKKEEEHLQIKVRDTGIGIPAAELPQIFDRFYQGDTGIGGTGIGLALTKELVEMMGGTITVSSEVGEGTEFLINLPIRLAQDTPKMNADDLRQKRKKPEAPSASAEKPLIPPAESRPDKDTVLIIEDNRDVVTYIESLLHKDYHIELAQNGQEGIDKALELVPDIIISDVMMPEKDGYEVCQALKNDERSSHIPIILLTAKSTDADRITGLREGADAYLTKPFHKEELFIRLEKLIGLRKALQERYSQSGFFPKLSKSDAPPSLNDKFLQKLIQVVQDRIDDPDLAVVHLCHAVRLSNTQVNRKLKALTDKTPSQFIRSVRLQKAYELLQTTDLNISEIAYDVGFSDPNYFSRSFSEEFGCPPSAMRK